MAVFDTMRHIRPNVSTVCVGLAASMGAVELNYILHRFITLHFRGIFTRFRAAGIMPTLIPHMISEQHEHPGQTLQSS